MRANLTGRRFGKLVALYEDGKVGKKIKWRCKCDCGNEKCFFTGNLVHWSSGQSCGCETKQLLREAATTHGMSKTRTYRIWRGMMQRCYNKRHGNYENYGANGVYVEERWHSFENFFADMGEAPNKLTLERKKHNLPYGPDNCCWLDMLGQENNKSNTIYLEYKGERKTLSDWVKETGMCRKVIYNRIFILGWSVELALTQQVTGKRGKNRTSERTLQQKACSAINIEIKMGRVVRPETCQHHGCSNGRPQAHHHKGYEKENWLDVVWLCQKHHPKDTAKRYEYNGESLTLSQWSEKTGVPRLLLYARAQRNGWKLDDSCFTVKRKAGRYLTHNGVTKNCVDWAKEIGVSSWTIYGRLEKGLPIEKVLEPITRKSPSTSDITQPASAAVGS